MEFISFLKNIDIASYIIIFTVIMVVVGLYIKRKTPFVKELVESAIIEAEKSLIVVKGKKS